MKNYLLLILATFLLNSACSVTKKYEEAKAAKSILLYEQYISKYPKSKYLPQAKQELNELYEERDWQIAYQSNTILGYRRFLNKYPNSPHGRFARNKIKVIEEKDAWSKATKQNTIYAYESFIKSYPNSQYDYEARNKIQQLKDVQAWELAEAESTSTAYKQYLTNFPNGTKRVIALERIQQIEIIEPAWKRAIQINTPAAYQDFLVLYRNSSYGTKAKEQLAILDNEHWRRANSQKTIQAYQRYLNIFPDGIYSQDAEKAIIDKEVDNIMKGDHGQLPPMSRSSNGYALSTTNEIEVFNNTSYVLTVRYSGPTDSKKIVLNPKQRQRLSLKKGRYRVAASVNATNVRNFAGEQSLEGGDYSSEFYIQTETHWGR